MLLSRILTPFSSASLATWLGIVVLKLMMCPFASAACEISNSDGAPTPWRRIRVDTSALPSAETESMTASTEPDTSPLMMKETTSGPASFFSATTASSPFLMALAAASSASRRSASARRASLMASMSRAICSLSTFSLRSSVTELACCSSSA